MATTWTSRRFVAYSITAFGTLDQSHNSFPHALTQRAPNLDGPTVAGKMIAGRDQCGVALSASAASRDNFVRAKVRADKRHRQPQYTAHHLR